jgi:iron complex outermembrane recepter protein
MNAIDHIEVQRGPASILYPNYMSQDFAGNQTPLAGTVNLILKSKINEQKTIFDLSYGSYNTVNGQIFHQNHFNRLNYFLGSTCEMSDYTNYGIAGSWLNMKKDPEYRKTKIFGGVTLFLDDSESRKLTMYYQGTFHSGDAGRIYRGFSNDYGTFNAGYEMTLDNGMRLQSHAGIRSYNRTWQESNFGVIDTLKSENGVYQVIIPADISLSWSHGKSGVLCFGGDFQEASYYTWTDPLKGYHSYVTKASSTQSGLYIEEQLNPVKGLILRGGIRIAYLRNIVALVSGGSPGNDMASWKKLLWSAGSKYSLNEIISLFTNIGTSFAAPGLKSSCGTIKSEDFGIPGYNGQLPNPDLKPESGLGIDAGIDLKFSSRLKIAARLFYSKVSEAIVDNIVSQNPSQTISQNAGSSNATGGELELSQKLSSSFSWYANYTLMKSNTRDNININQNDVRLAFSPENILNLGFLYSSVSGFIFSPALNYNGGYFDGIDRTNRKYFKPGVLLNLYISKRFSGNKSYPVDLFTRLSNITNNDYEMPWQFRNPGFSGMLGIKVTFK